jgi:hypothetical protein
LRLIQDTKLASLEQTLEFVEAQSRVLHDEFLRQEFQSEVRRISEGHKDGKSVVLAYEKKLGSICKDLHTINSSVVTYGVLEEILDALKRLEAEIDALTYRI